MGFHHPVALWHRLHEKHQATDSQSFHRFARLFGRLVARHYRVSRPSYNRYEPERHSNAPPEVLSEEAEAEAEAQPTAEDGKDTSRQVICQDDLSCATKAGVSMALLAYLSHGEFLLEAGAVVLTTGALFTALRLMDPEASGKKNVRYSEDILAATLMVILATLPLGLLVSILTASFSWFIFSFLDQVGSGG